MYITLNWMEEMAEEMDAENRLVLFHLLSRFIRIVWLRRMTIDDSIDANTNVNEQTEFFGSAVWLWISFRLFLSISFSILHLNHLQGKC